MRRIALSAAGLLLALGCAGDGDDPDAAPPANDVSAAEARYDRAAFDTVAWESEEAALVRGEEVWRYACAQCHGPAGAGDGGFVQEGDTLRPPSFLVPGWRFAADREGLIHQVYVGTDQAMPHWGLRRMRPRDIDAVTRYIQQQLVPAGTESG